MEKVNWKDPRTNFILASDIFSSIYISSIKTIVPSKQKNVTQFPRNLTHTYACMYVCLYTREIQCNIFFICQLIAEKKIACGKLTNESIDKKINICEMAYNSLFKKLKCI